MEQYKTLERLLAKLYRPHTFPVAVKLFKEEPEEFPEGTVFPHSFLDYPISFCQGIGIVRRYGWKVAFRREDNACPFYLFFLGVEEMPEIVASGEMAYPYFTETKEQGALAEASLTKLPAGTTTTTYMEPLTEDLTYEPDVILVYGNVAQTSKLIAAANYRKGSGIQGGPYSARGACSSSIATPLATKECRVTLPGGGERVAGHAADDELVFSIPKEQVEEVIYGLETTNTMGVARYPSMFKGMQAQPTFPDKYNELAKRFGMVTKARKE